MATNIDIKKLQRGLREMKRHTAPYEKIENHSEMRHILIMVNNDDIDYASFSEEALKQLCRLYRAEEMDDIEDGLSDVSRMIKTLSGLPPGGVQDVGFF